MITNKEVHELACSKGWWTSMRSWIEIKSLIHSEASECLEAARNRESQERIIEEACDICIRSRDAIEAINDGLIIDSYNAHSVADVIGIIHEYLESNDHLIMGKKYVLQRVIDFIKNSFGHEIIEEGIKKKHEYNKTRPIRHGNKAF